jgi:hypothetical protein
LSRQHQLAHLRSLTLLLVENVIEWQSCAAECAAVGGESPDIALSVRTTVYDAGDQILAGMLTDTDELHMLPVISRILPQGFPSTRNPFMLAKKIDDLANVSAVAPEHEDAYQVR